jgi:hypothetical protein
MAMETLGPETMTENGKKVRGELYLRINYQPA